MLDPQPLLDILHPASAGDIAELLGVTRRTVIRWRNGHTGIDPTKADAYAVAAGRLAYEIWPELTDQAVAEATRTCEHCHTTFVPNHPQQRYCRPVCKVSAEIARRPRRARTGTRPCDWCGTQFHSTRANHRHCSTTCYRAAYYDRNGDNERAYQRDYNAHRRAAERNRRHAA